MPCRICVRGAADISSTWRRSWAFRGGYAGWGSYVASKFALAGLTETLAAELAELNIRATVVYPGPVRTGFLSKETLVVAQRTIADYTEAQASLDLHLNGLDGKQAGNPDKVASLILQAAFADAPLRASFAGKIANTLAEQKNACSESGP